MFKYTLSAVLTAALWTSILPATAQNQPPQAPQKPPTGQTVPGTPVPATPPKPVLGTDVVGSVFGKQVTWDDLIDKVRKENPTGFTQMAGQAAGTTVAAKLFGTPPQTSVTVTQDEVLAAIRQTPPQPIVQALDAMLLQSAFDQEAAKQGVVITDAQVNAQLDRAIDNYRKQGRIQPGVTNDQFLVSQHLTRQQLYPNVHQTVLALALIQKDLTKTLGHPIGPEDFLQAHHILIRANQITPTSSAIDKKADVDAKAKLEKLVAEIKAGKITFDQAAKQNSDDPGSKEKGGDLGVFMRGSMVPEFDAAAFKLKVNELSPIVRSSYGYHLIQVTKLGKDVPAVQRDDALQNRESQLYRDYVTGLRQRSNLTDNIRPAMGGPMIPGAPRPGQ